MASSSEGKQTDQSEQTVFTFPVAIPEKLTKVQLPILSALKSSPNILLPEKSYDDKLFIANIGAESYELYDLSSQTDGSILEPVATHQEYMLFYHRPIALPMSEYGFVSETHLSMYQVKSSKLSFIKKYDFQSGYNTMSRIDKKGIVHLFENDSFYIEEYPKFNRLKLIRIQSDELKLPADASCHPMFVTSNKQVLLGYETQRDQCFVLYNLQNGSGRKLANLDTVLQNKDRCTMDEFDNLWIGTHTGEIESYTLDGTKLLSESIGKCVRGVTIGEGCLYAHYVGHDRKYHLDKFVIE